MANNDQLRTTRLARAESALGSFTTDASLSAAPLSTARLAAEPVTETQSETASVLTSSVSDIQQTTTQTDLTTDVTPPAALRIYEPVATDGVIAAWEANNRVHVRGQAEEEPGATVTLTFGDQSWQSVVNQWGYWNASMPPETLQGLPDGNYSMTLTITDKAGNSTDTLVDFGLYVDRTLAPTLTLDPIMKDNAVSADEAIYGMRITGTSTHLPVGAKVTAMINGVSYQGVVLDKEGHWSVSLNDTQLSAIPDGIYSVEVSAADPNGNIGTASADVTLITHWSSIPALYFDSVTSDNVVNALEMQQALTLTGSLSNVLPGQTLWINDGGGKDYQATILADGRWTLTIPAAEVADFIHRGELKAWGMDGAGNHIDGSFEFNIVTTLPPVYYEMNIGGDRVLNYTEAHSDLSFYIEGVKSLTINGKTYEPAAGMVTLSSEDLLALPDGPVTATVWQEDQYGNSASNTLENFFTVAIHTRPGLTLNTPFDDGVIDSADVNSWHLIEGSSTHLDQGALVTLTLGDQSYSATVNADGNWALTILAGQLAPLSDGEYAMTVTAQDANGNLASASQNVTVAWHDAQSATTLAAETGGDDGQISTLLAAANEDDLSSWLTHLTGDSETPVSRVASEPVSDSLMAQLRGDADSWQLPTSHAAESSTPADVSTTLADLLHGQHVLHALA